jgi:hypothetical protein
MERSDRLFEYIFNPERVAIVGALPHDLGTLAQMSRKIVDRLFLVNPNYREIRAGNVTPASWRWSPRSIMQSCFFPLL